MRSGAMKFPYFSFLLSWLWRNEHEREFAPEA
jgi:hypothetical protein